MTDDRGPVPDGLPRIVEVWPIDRTVPGLCRWFDHDGSPCVDCQAAAQGPAGRPRP